jgi:proteasome accessory factor A
MVTALDVQWALFEAAVNFAERVGLDALGADGSGDLCLRRWEEVLTQLERDPLTAAATVDWVAKFRLVEGFRERHGLEPSSAKLRAIDLQYHDLRPEKSLADRVGLEQLVTPEEIATAEVEPPTTTRAYFRGRCIARYHDAIESANWDAVVFDLGSDPLRRVPMMDPTRGTKAEVAQILDQSPTAAELLHALES